MTKEQAGFWARLWEIDDYLTKIVNEFETTFKNSEIKQKLPSVQFVYMHEIIINLWMILGNGKNDKFKLSRIKILFEDHELRNKASSVIDGHRDLIEKLDKNRNWISAHLDPQFMGLGFSETFVKKFEERFQIDASALGAKNKSSERYTPDDMRSDLIEIKQILKEVNELWELIIPRNMELVD